MGRRGHRIGAPDQRAIGLGDAETGKLPGPEAKARITRTAQAEQAGRPDLNRSKRLPRVLVVTGHTNTGPMQIAQAQCGATFTEQTPIKPGGSWLCPKPALSGG